MLWSQQPTLQWKVTEMDDGAWRACFLVHGQSHQPNEKRPLTPLHFLP
jgi:hypothetical protein